jgi:hypothetical protein
MKQILTISAAALLASITFAAAQTPQQTQTPAESGQKVERNPSGAVGGSEKNPSPTMMKGKVTGPTGGAPAYSGQQAERNPSGKVGGSEDNPSPRATTGESVDGPRTSGPIESGQAAERNPDGSTGGSEKRPSPR